PSTRKTSAPARSATSATWGADGTSPTAAATSAGRCSCSGHDLDPLGPGDLALLLELQDPLEGPDRDGDLVEVGLAGRGALQPEAGRQHRADDRVVAVLAGEPDDLVGQPGDRQQGHDARDDEPLEVELRHRVQGGEEEDRDDHDPEQERGAAANVDQAVAL